MTALMIAAELVGELLNGEFIAAQGHEQAVAALLAHPATDSTATASDDVSADWHWRLLCRARCRLAARH